MFKKITRLQMESIKNLWFRELQTVKSNIDWMREVNTVLPPRYVTLTHTNFLAFRRSVQVGHDCLMVQSRGIWIGIEKDGYTHS